MTGSAGWRAARLFLPATFVLGLVLLGPLIATAKASLSPNVLLQFEGHSLANYRYLVGVPYYQQVLLRTLGTALVSTTIALLVGYPAALALRSIRGRHSSLMIMGLTFPILAGPLVVILGWMIGLSDGGPILRPLIAIGLVPPLRLLGTQAAVDISLVHFVLPFVILTLFASFRQIPDDMIEAARSLGAGWWQVLTQILWPLSLPGVLSATLLSFSLAASSYISPHYLGGAGELTLTSQIAQFILGSFNSEMAGAAALILLMIMLALTLLFSRLVNGRIRQ
jgi:putative spermidine/putrescine transport system permease protein